MPEVEFAQEVLPKGRFILIKVGVVEQSTGDARTGVRIEPYSTMEDGLGENENV